MGKRFLPTRLSAVSILLVDQQIGLFFPIVERSDDRDGVGVGSQTRNATPSSCGMAPMPEREGDGKVARRVRSFLGASTIIIAILEREAGWKMVCVACVPDRFVAIAIPKT